jgi:hypothetical protein
LQILEEESKLLFHLQQQQLIELIRTGNVKEALAFAQEYLAYKGEENEALLDELGAPVPCQSVCDVSHAGVLACLHSALFFSVYQFPGHIDLCQGRFLHTVAIF